VSKKILIFMNEQLHARIPKHGVMTVQDGMLQHVAEEIDLRIGLYPKVWLHEKDNKITISGKRIKILYKPELCSEIKTHKVKAWIEVT
jgi:hypothetical protein